MCDKYIGITPNLHHYTAEHVCNVECIYTTYVSRSLLFTFDQRNEVRVWSDRHKSRGLVGPERHGWQEIVLGDTGGDSCTIGWEWVTLLVAIGDTISDTNWLLVILSCNVWYLVGMVTLLMAEFCKRWH